MNKKSKLIVVSIAQQTMACFEHDQCIASYRVSTGTNGAGELINSQCTPRGWHKVHSILGMQHDINSVFVARQWTGELYSAELAQNNPNRDWILTRILQLDGLEPGRNQGGTVDSLSRYIYIHGTPDSTQLGIPGSHGCVRMNNEDIVALAQWATTDTMVYIQ